MTEPPAIPPPETPDEPAAEPPPHQPARRSLLPWFSGAGFLILAAAIIWVWQQSPSEPPVATQENEQQLTALEARIARLEQRPASQTPDLGPLTGRVSALEQRPAATQAASGQDLTPLADRITALEQRQSPNFAPIEARIAAIEARQSAESQLAGRIDALSARADSLETAQRVAQSDLARRLDADEARIGTVERSVGQTAALAERVGRIARIEAVRLALDAGQKLGDIPGAPPPLARFANAAPPTEAGLRLAFPQAAQSALAAARPAAEGKPLLARIWAETQDLVTVRQGDHVLLGDPAAGVLSRARTDLDAGDLAGAVAAVAALTGAPAQSMAAWLTDARALLEARAALTEWATRA
jgi:hypothetical protein